MLTSIAWAATQPQSNTTISENGLSVWESLNNFKDELVLTLPYLSIGLVVLFFTWMVNKIISTIIEKVLKKTHLRASLQDLIQKMVYILIWAIGILAATTVTTGLGMGQIVAALGLTSIALGFAFKDIVENFFAGILILWKFPFEIGDYIICEGIEGKVETIEIRMTLIRRTDGQLVVVPNAMMFKNAVRIMTARKVRRTTIIAGVAYDEDVAQSRTVIEEAVKGCASVEKDKPVEIFAQEFAASSINFEVTWWTGPTPLDIRKSRDEVVEAIKKALDAAGIEIPFPYRTLTFKEPIKTQKLPDKN